MNTTTFTIESVHGVKQTFVLGPPSLPTGDETARRHSGERDPNSATNDSSDVKQTPR